MIARMSIATDLQAFAAQQERPFTWGSHDCGTVAAEWLQQREGAAPAQCWRDLRTAMRHISEHGGELSAAVSLALAREPISALMAQIGDLVLIPGTSGVGAALGICAGRHALCLGAHGMVAVEMSRASCAWRVGGAA